MPFRAEMQGDAVRFRLWAPAAKRVDVEIISSEPGTNDAGGRRTLGLLRVGSGWYERVTSEARAGSRYRFIIDGSEWVADPASRFQPDGVHGPSEVVDPSAYVWSPIPWTRPPWHELVFYELWKGTRADFDAIQGPKPYRKAYMENVKQFLEKMDVEWNSPILEWGTNLTGLNQS